ncbi:tyrosine-type recombinase/integrase [Sphingomonas sp. GB1N7]|uniref:tyrosine-type recombinase/integrase n=1 Tax=Parasphingomonas caseinilytica TaxID=3096158 RepID=UPI002FC5B037
MAKEVIKARATTTQIDAIKASAGVRLVSCELVANLYLQVTPQGAKKWLWVGRLQGGTTRKWGIGKWPAWSLADARAEGERCNALRDRGLDPKIVAEEAAKAAADEAKAAATNSVRAVFDQWIEHKRIEGKANKTLPEYKRIMARYWDADKWDIPVRDITRADVKAMIRAVQSKGAMAQSNRFLRVVFPFLEWAVNEDIIADNPAVKIGMAGEKRVGEHRALSISEMALLYRAVEDWDADRRDAIRLLILCGTRKMEAFGASLSDYDPESGIWTLPLATHTDDRGHTYPVSHTKTDRLHHMLLPPLARKIFESREGKEFAFHSAPHKFMFNDIGAKAHEAMERVGDKPVEPWGLHKIKKGVRTALGSNEMDELGEVFSENIGEIVTQHSLGGLNRTYNKSTYARQVGRALAAWERLLKAEIAKQDGTNVVSISVPVAG